MVKNKKQNSEKKLTLLTVISIILLVVMMIGTTFSFFTARVLGTFNTVNIETAELGTAVAEGTAVNLYVAKEDMLIEDGRNNFTVYKEADEPGTLTITAEMGNFVGSINCVYNIIYRPTTAYMFSRANRLFLREFTIRGSQSLVSGNSFATYSGIMPETNLTGVTRPITLVDRATLSVYGRRRSASVEWKIMPRYYNLGIDQTDNSGKMFGGIVEVGQLICRYSF